MARVLQIFDTTLRDGEQSPGVSLNPQEKVEIAKQLARLGVDVIEAGFPVASPGDFAAVQAVAEEVEGPYICALARAVAKDVERAGEALRSADKPCIHTFIATSDIHMKYKLNKRPDEVLRMAVDAVRLARSYVDMVEFSAEDATRSDRDFLCEVFAAVLENGAKIINIPDTVGYATPQEFYDLITYIREHVPGIDQAIISVHCHNDLGLAVANSLAAVKAGAQQVECAVNGLGERAGNAALEEVVMALRTRQDHYGAITNVVTEQLYRTSRLVCALTGVSVQPNKAIVGDNAFAHESGIHQDGVLKERTTYEIMTPESIGLRQSRLVLGKHSGRHAFREKLRELGYSLTEKDINRAFERFIELADKKKAITDRDIEAIIETGRFAVPGTFILEYVHVVSGNTTVPTATVRIRHGDEVVEEAACGDGPIDAVYRAINRATKVPVHLLDYALQAVTGGADALGDATVRVKDNGHIHIGRGTSTDVIEASALAYVHAINKIVNSREKYQSAGEV
ncbi:MAG: 2-isopropylmalate synthase [Firmicutes bacterium]|nr:2-isopropylmalate synthase [Bacillota bacterium]